MTQYRLVVCKSCGTMMTPEGKYCAACGKARVAAKPASPRPAGQKEARAQAPDAQSLAESVKPKNAVLGWFVVGAFAVVAILAISAIDPLPMVAAAIFVIALALTRIIRKRFSNGWLIGAAVTSGVLVLGGISSADARFISFLIPGSLALIAGIRGRSEK
jgi:hypothetical protein